MGKLKWWLIPLMVLALLLAACAEEPAGEEPLGEEPLEEQPLEEEPLATEPLATEPLATEPLPATEPAATEPAATEAVASPQPTEAAGTEVVTETELEGMVAIPYEMFIPATAPEGTTEAETAGTPMAGTPMAGTPAGTPMAGTPVAEVTPEAGEGIEARTLVQASTLLGSEIVATNGDTIGTVNDVLVNQSGTIQFIVLDPDEAFFEVDPAGLPGEVEAGELADENTMLIFNATPQELQENAIDITDELLEQEAFALDVTGAEFDNADLLQGMFRVSNYTGFDLQTADAQELGQVQDLLLDLQQSVVEWVVVDVGTFLGVDQNVVAIPFERFTVVQDPGVEADLTLDVTQETLQNAPTIDLNELSAWPQPFESDWETEVETFWETAG